MTDLDQIALGAARAITQLTYTTMVGGETQYKAAVQCKVADALRKAQAEALDEIAWQPYMRGFPRQKLLERSAELRRQAEGAADD